MVRPLTNKTTNFDRLRSDETRRRIDTEDVERVDNPILGIVEGVLLTLIVCGLLTLLWWLL